MDFSVHSKWACRMPESERKYKENSLVLNSRRLLSVQRSAICWYHNSYTFICIICITGGICNANRAERSRAFILKSTRAENLFFHSILWEYLFSRSFFFSRPSLPSSPLLYVFLLNKNIIFASILTLYAVKWNAFSGKILENERIPIGHGSLPLSLSMWHVMRTNVLKQSNAEPTLFSDVFEQQRILSL